MNIVTFKGSDAPMPLRGDIFRSNTGELFILSKVDEENWCAISLKDGNRWSDPKSNIEYAIGNLKFVKRNADIIVT